MSGRLTGAALVLLALGLAPATAGAVTTHPSVHFNAAVQGTHNYAIGISNRGRKQVVLTVEKGAAQVTYTAPGKVTRDAIEADFGALGRVSVRFSAPRSASHHAPHSSRCKGPAPRDDLGTLRGTIRFRGEEGFTEVALHHTPADRFLVFKRTCHKRADRASASTRPREPRQIPTLVAAVERSPERNVSFAALGLQVAGPQPPGLSPGLFVIASEGERREGVAIFRQLLLIGEEGVLLSPLGTQPISATVALPRPFSGSAALQREPGAAPVWSGDLSVDLPGDRGIALTGPGFQGIFCRSAIVQVFDKCALPVEEAQTSQLSGSQSQAFLETKLSWLR